MLIAQITDTHVTEPGGRTCGGTVDTNSRLAAAIEVLNGLTEELPRGGVWKAQLPNDLLRCVGLSPHL